MMDKENMNVLGQLPTPQILMRDFNAHNPLWGSKKKKQAQE